MWRTDLVRLGLCALLASLLALGMVSMPVLLVTVFLLATVGTLFSSAAPALLPTLVPSSQLHQANARLAAGRASGENFLGPPIGSWLFGAFSWLPFATDALTFGVSAWCVRALPRQPAAEPSGPSGPAEPTNRTGETMRHQIWAGITWIWRIRTLRMLLLSGSLLALATSAFLAIFVLFTLEVLRLSSVWYGVLISLFAIGSLAGSVLSTRLVSTLGIRWATQLAAVTGAVAFLGVGITPRWPVVAASLVVFGTAAGIWNTTAITIRQTLTPPTMLGRISSAFAVTASGSAPLGALLGGLVAARVGLPAAVLCAAGIAGISAAILLFLPTDITEPD
jgi:Na+/melibiose symporter-like transporter